MEIKRKRGIGGFTPRTVVVTIQTQDELDALIAAMESLCNETVGVDIGSGYAETIVNMVDTIAMEAE